MGLAQLAKTQQQAAYNYSKGWSTTAHPIPDLSEEEYIELAEAAAPDIAEQARSFMDDNGFSYIEIPHSAFYEYETSPLNFREWLDQYCEEHGMDSRADFAIIGPRVKTLESAHRKTATGQTKPDRLIDYLGIEFVALKQTEGKKNKHSLNTMDSAMNAIENDPQTLARKNHYWIPHKKTQFRGHKTLREATVPEGHELSGLTILAEVKIEHESQMDIDKLTRKFINIGRSVQSAHIKVSSTFSAAKGDAKRGHKFCRDIQNMQEAVDALGAMLYNRVFTDSGMNRFMKPDEIGNYPALSRRALISAAEDTVNEHFTNGNRDSLLKTIMGMSMFDEFRAPKPGARKKRTKEYA